MAQWPCPHCTFLNHSALPACEICGCPCPNVSKSLQTIELVDLSHEAETLDPSPVQAWVEAFDKSLHGLSPANLDKLRVCLETGRATGRAKTDFRTPLLALGWHDNNGALVMGRTQEAEQQRAQAGTLLLYASLLAVQEQVEQETNARIQQAQTAMVQSDRQKGDVGNGTSEASTGRAKRARVCRTTARAVSTPARSHSDEVKVRLALPSGEQLSIAMDGSFELIYLLVVPAVQNKLCRQLDLPQGALSAQELANAFSLVGPPPDRSVYGAGHLQRVTLKVALPGGDGVLRVQPRQRSNVQLASFTPFENGSKGICDRVVVIRLRRTGHEEGVRPRKTQMGSPVLLFKNYLRDRGVKLMTEFGIIVQPIAYGQAHYSTAAVQNTQLVQHHAEAVLQLCRELPVVKCDKMALKAMSTSESNARTYGWHQPVGLAYPRGSSLHRHVDQAGGWVVLFSFGLTCDFYAGGRVVNIESGDALVFNGGQAHQVLHGLDRVHERPTFNGKNQGLSHGMLEKLSETRVSIQVRQVK